MIDEQRDIRSRHFTAILRPDFYGSGVGNDILPSIPCNVVVDTPFQCFQQRGFAVVAPAGDQGDPPADAHAPERSPVGQFQRHRQLVRRMEGNRVFHGPVGDAALPGQDGTV